MRHVWTAVTVFTIGSVCMLFSVACHNDGGSGLNKSIAGDNTPGTPGDDGDGGGGNGNGNGNDTGGGDGGSGNGGGNGGGGGGGNGGGTTDTRFAGTWISSFGDDLPQGTGRRQYAMRLSITRNGDSLSGTGSMMRFYNSGSTAFDAQPLAITATGTASGNDAMLTMSGTPGVFAHDPVWYLRIAGTRLAGMYAERDTNLIVERSGHSIWYATGAVDLNGSWSAAFDDTFGSGSSFAARDRTAVATLAVTGTDITGLGSYAEQRSNGAPEEFAFDVAAGTLSGPEARFRFVNFSPANGEVDWFGYVSGGVICSAYGQFNDSSQLVRFGNATWHESGDTAPGDFDHDWTTSFGDSAAAGNLFADYVFQMTGVSVAANTLSGTMRVLDETAAQPAFVNYAIDNGSITGNRLTMDVTRNGDRFSWSMRLAGSVLAGSYTHYDSSDSFVSRGHAEWTFGSASGVPGKYVAPFADTSTTNATENRASQLATISIDSMNSEGALSGTGSLRLGGEESRRQFAVSGTVSDTGHIIVVWESGVDLFGNTVWNLRKAGNTLYGTYTNFASDNQSIEFQGHATFIRTSGN